LADGKMENVEFPHFSQGRIPYSRALSRFGEAQTHGLLPFLVGASGIDPNPDFAKFVPDQERYVIPIRQHPDNRATSEDFHS
jgi:hypothetical protein